MSFKPPVISICCKKDDINLPRSLSKSVLQQQKPNEPDDQVAWYFVLCDDGSILMWKHSMLQCNQSASSICFT